VKGRHTQAESHSFDVTLLPETVELNLLFDMYMIAPKNVEYDSLLLLQISALPTSQSNVSVLISFPDCRWYKKS
jgi:hypothetical protein